MKKILLTLLIGLVSINLNAQLYFKNSTNKDISVAVGWFSNSTNNYQTQGWYVIEPNKFVNSGLTFSSEKDFFFYYIKGTKGHHKMLVSASKFNIIDATSEIVKKENSAYYWAYFYRKDVQFGFFDDKTYTVDIDESYNIKDDDMKIMANLVYEDGSLSDFDLISDSNINLWNTTIGEGSAGKPSHKTRFFITIPTSDSKYEVKVLNANNTLYSSGVKNGMLELFNIETGCETIYLIILENNAEIFKKEIIFECGE